MTTHTLNQLRATCPRCLRNRFIPHAWAPFCTRSCKRDAETPAPVAGKEE